MKQILMLSAVLAVGGLTACGSGSSGGTTTTPAASGETSQVTAALSPTDASSVVVTWNPVSFASDYVVERSGNGTDFVQVTTVMAISGTHYTDAHLPDGTYTYRVRVVTSGGTSAGVKSGAVSVGGVTTPANTSSVTASRFNDSAVRVTWAAVPGASSYKLERASGTGAYTEIATLSDTTYLDTSLPEGSYKYRVRSVNSAGISGGTESSAVTLQANQAPADPMYVSAMDMSGNVSLMWASVSGASSYQLERQQENGAYVVVATLPGTTYQDSGLSDGKYTYRVRAINSVGMSGGTLSDPVYIGGESKYRVGDFLGNWTLNYGGNSLNVTFSATEQYSNTVYRAIGQDSSGNVYRAAFDATTHKYLIGGLFDTPQEIYFRFDSIAADGTVSGVYWLDSDSATQRPFTGKRSR